MAVRQPIPGLLVGLARYRHEVEHGDEQERDGLVEVDEFPRAQIARMGPGARRSPSITGDILLVASSPWHGEDHRIIIDVGNSRVRAYFLAQPRAHFPLSAGRCLCPGNWRMPALAARNRTER